MEVTYKTTLFHFGSKKYNGMAMSFPRKIIDTVNLKVGEEIDVDASKDGKTILLRRK